MCVQWDDHSIDGRKDIVFLLLKIKKKKNNNKKKIKK